MVYYKHGCSKAADNLRPLAGRQGGKERKMTRTEEVIETLRSEGFSTQQIIDALCDGQALEELGLTDEDQTDVECAFYDLERSLEH